MGRERAKPSLARCLPRSRCCVCWILFLEFLLIVGEALTTPTTPTSCSAPFSRSQLNAKPQVRESFRRAACSASPGLCVLGLGVRGSAGRLPISSQRLPRPVLGVPLLAGRQRLQVALRFVQQVPSPQGLRFAYASGAPGRQARIWGSRRGHPEVIPLLLRRVSTRTQSPALGTCWAAADLALASASCVNQDQHETRPSGLTPFTDVFPWGLTSGSTGGPGWCTLLLAGAARAHLGVC